MTLSPFPAPGLLRTIILFCAISAVAACAYEAPAHSLPITSVDDLWRGYDPRALPLEAKVFDEKSGVTGTIRKICFTSEVSDGFAVQIVGYYGFPADSGKKPAILHIHGGSQIASRAYVEYWTRRGYATLSINWGGLPQGDGLSGETDWGPLAMGLNDPGSDRRMQPDVRANAWFHWAIACRRAITYLEQQPEVDAHHIGIFGISRGGRLTWLLAGLDERIKAAVSIYGAAAVQDAYTVANPEAAPFSPADLAIWRACLDAPAYAPRIKIPFFFLSAANDFYGVIDRAELALGQIPQVETWRSYSPHYSHHVDPAQSASLPLWMDHWLKGAPAWPATPQLHLVAAGPDHNPVATVLPECAARVQSVIIYYSTGVNPRTRFWRTAPATQSPEGKPGPSWSASLPLSAIADGLRAYANVTYVDGLSLSTPVAAIAGGELRRADVHIAFQPTRLIDDFKAGARDWFYPEAGTDPLVSDKPWVDVVSGPTGGRALRGNPAMKERWRLSTRKITDAQWRAPVGAALGLQMESEHAGQILALARVNPGTSRERTFAAMVNLKGGEWENVVLPPAVFRDVRNGAALEDFSTVEDIAIQAEYIVRGRTRQEDRTLGATWRGVAPALSRCAWITSP